MRIWGPRGAPCNEQDKREVAIYFWPSLRVGGMGAFNLIKEAATNVMAPVVLSTAEAAWSKASAPAQPVLHQALYRRRRKGGQRQCGTEGPEGQDYPMNRPSK